MRHETQSCLADIERSSTLIAEAVNGIKSDDFVSNWEKQSAVERQIMILGEALVRIRGFEPTVLDKIPSSNKVIGLRNVLAHGYDAVDAVAIYEFASTFVPELLAIAKELLGST